MSTKPTKQLKCSHVHVHAHHSLTRYTPRRSPCELQVREGMDHPTLAVTGSPVYLGLADQLEAVLLGLGGLEEHIQLQRLQWQDGPEAIVGLDVYELCSGQRLGNAGHLGTWAAQESAAAPQQVRERKAKGWGGVAGWQKDRRVFRAGGHWSNPAPTLGSPTNPNSWGSSEWLHRLMLVLMAS